MRVCSNNDKLKPYGDKCCGKARHHFRCSNYNIKTNDEPGARKAEQYQAGKVIELVKD